MQHWTLIQETSADLTAMTTPSSHLGWEQDQAHPLAWWDSHGLKGDCAKAPALPRTDPPGTCLGAAGFVSQSGKLSCSSEVSSASTPRSKEKPQQNLLQYFPPLLMLSCQRYFDRPFHLSSQSEDTWTVQWHKDGLVHKVLCWGPSHLFGKPQYDAASFLQLCNKSLSRV